MEVPTKAIVIVSALLFLASAGSSQAPAPAPSIEPLDALYVEECCNATQFPSVCYQTLARYAADIQQDPGRLATAAMALSLSRSSRLSTFLYNATNQTGPVVVPPALNDCISNVDDAVNQIKRSVDQINSAVNCTVVQDFRFQMSNVETWMSAALTDQETCTDGFDKVTGWDQKDALVQQAVSVKKITSNALALANNYATYKAANF